MLKARQIDTRSGKSVNECVRDNGSFALLEVVSPLLSGSVTSVTVSITQSVSEPLFPSFP